MSGRPLDVLQREKAFAQMILESIPGLFFAIDAQGHLLRCNSAYQKLFPVSCDGQPSDPNQPDVDPIRYDCIKAHIREALEKGSASSDVCIQSQGERRCFRLTSARTQVDETACVMGFGIDITDSKAIEALQAGQNRVLVSLATGEKLEKVLTTLILAAEQQCEGMLGSIMLLDEEGLHLSPIAAPSLPPDYVAAIGGLRIGPNVGSCGAAAYLRKPVFVESIETSPNWVLALELTRHHGLYACWSHPIFSTDNRVLGTFAMYYRKSRKPDSTLMRIIESGAHLAGLAIERHRVESQLKAAKEAAEAANRDLEQRVQERTAELHKVHKQLLDASREAGMAEVATGVLHNVGNVLNSVNVSTSIIMDRVGRSPVMNLSKASALMESHRDDLGAFLTSDERGKMLPNYFAAMAKELGEENAAILDELAVLARGVEHIKEVVRTQQDCAKNSTFRQRCNPAGLMENALQMNLISLERHQIDVVREVQDLEEVDLDKHKILQILINLISNAKDALTRGEHTGTRRITVRLSATDQGSQKRLRFEVSDTGVGIPRENLELIFTHGFTTRTGGHGFGLHTAANTAREMDGTLTAFSDGAGKGATFVLEIPVEQNKAAAA
ncbi:MAG: ATP-binding protein [Tepidisphaeraceae bacterium]